MGIVGDVRGVLNSNERASVKFTKLMKVLVAFVRRYSTSISVATIALVGLRILSYYYKASPDSLERAAEFLETQAENGKDSKPAVESVLTEVGKVANSTESDDFLAKLGKPVEKVVKEMKQSATSESIEESNDVLGSYSFGMGVGAAVLTGLLTTLVGALSLARLKRNAAPQGAQPARQPRPSGQPRQGGKGTALVPYRDPLDASSRTLGAVYYDRRPPPPDPPRPVSALSSGVHRVRSAWTDKLGPGDEREFSPLNSVSKKRRISHFREGNELNARHQIKDAVMGWMQKRKAPRDTPPPQLRKTTQLGSSSQAEAQRVGMKRTAEPPDIGNSSQAGARKPPEIRIGGAPPSRFDSATNNAYRNPWQGLPKSEQSKQATPPGTASKKFAHLGGGKGGWDTRPDAPEKPQKPPSKWNVQINGLKRAGR